jgi:hypothetical protein
LGSAIQLLNTDGGEGFAPIGDDQKAAPTVPPAADHPALPAYPDESFKTNAPKWRQLVERGARSPQEIIEMVSSKNTLSPAQIRAIQNLTPIESGVPA